MIFHPFGFHHHNMAKIPRPYHIYTPKNDTDPDQNMPFGAL